MGHIARPTAIVLTIILVASKIAYLRYCLISEICGEASLKKVTFKVCRRQELYFDGLVQVCSNSIANAMELLQNK